MKDVQDSLEGWIAGGSICADLKNHKDFLRPLYHHWEGRHTGRHAAAPHIKSYSRSAQQTAAYVVLTSANMSAAAWGSLQKNETQLAIRHYEMGILVLPSVTRRTRHMPAFTCTPHHPVYRHSDQRVPVVAKKEEGKAGKEERVQLWLPAMRGPREREGVLDDSVGFRVVCPLPYAVDSRPYEEAADEPWAWDVSHMEPDWAGRAVDP